MNTSLLRFGSAPASNRIVTIGTWPVALALISTVPLFCLACGTITCCQHLILLEDQPKGRIASNSASVKRLPWGRDIRQG